MPKFLIKNNDKLKRLKKTYKYADSTEGIGQNILQYVAIPEKTSFFGHFSLYTTPSSWYIGLVKIID